MIPLRPPRSSTACRFRPGRFRRIRFRARAAAAPHVRGWRRAAAPASAPSRPRRLPPTTTRARLPPRRRARPAQSLDRSPVDRKGDEINNSPNRRTENPNSEKFSAPVIKTEKLSHPQQPFALSRKNGSAPVISAETLPHDSPAQSSIHVSIGRIEIRTPKTTVEKPTSVSNVARPKIMTLDDYIRQRRGATP